MQKYPVTPNSLNSSQYLPFFNLNNATFLYSHTIESSVSKYKKIIIIKQTKKCQSVPYFTYSSKRIMKLSVSKNLCSCTILLICIGTLVHVDVDVRCLHRFVDFSSNFITYFVPFPELSAVDFSKQKHFIRISNMLAFPQTFTNLIFKSHYIYERFRWP